MKASKFLRLKALWESKEQPITTPVVEPVIVQVPKQPEPIVEPVKEEVKQEPVLTKTSKKKLDEQPAE
jgi:hypothetical protein